MQSDREKAIHASMDNSKNSHIPHSSSSGETALPKNEGGHKIHRLFNFSKDRKLKHQKKEAEQKIRDKAIKEQMERAELENRETARLQAGGKIVDVGNLESESILPKGFKNEKEKAQKFIVKQEINKKRKRAEDIEMELMQLRKDVKNPNKSTKKFEIEEKEKKLGQEKAQLAHELQGLDRLFGMTDNRKGLFGTFAGNKEESTLPQGVLKQRLAQKERDFERFRKPSKLFPSGSQKKRLEKNPETGETELTSHLTPSVRKRFEDEGLQNRFIGFDEEGQRVFVHAPTKENKPTTTNVTEQSEPNAEPDRSANQVLSDILANPRGT